MFATFARRAVAGLVASLGLVAAMAAPAGAPTEATSAWPQDGHDAAHTWRNMDERAINLRSFARLKPTASVKQGQFYVGAASQTGEGTLYSCNNLSRITASDGVTGAALWSRTDLPGGECGNVAVSARAIFVTTQRRFDYWGGYFELGAYVMALHPTTGATLWETRVDDAESLGFENPTLVGRRLYVTDGRSSVYAFDATTGAQLWQASTDGRLNNAATVGQGKVFVSTWTDGDDERIVQAFDAATGARVWRHSLGQFNSWHAPMLMDGRLIVTTSSGLVRALDAATGTLLWQTQMAGYIPEPPAAGLKTLFISQSSTVVALDAATGAVHWSRTLPGQSLASNLVAVGGGVAYMGLEGVANLRLGMLDGRTGASVKAPGSYLYGSHVQLTVGQGRVQVATNQGSLYVFSLPAP